MMGIEVLGPDVNESRENFTPVRKGRASIRFGMAVKGVGEVAAQILIGEREADAPSSPCPTYSIGLSLKRSTNVCSSI